MTLRTSIRLPIVASAVAAVLVIAPTASASSDPGSLVLRRSAPNVVAPHGTQARYNAQKVMPQTANPFSHSGSITTSVPSVPDRIDGLGSARGPQVVQLPLATTNDGGLSWTDAAIGAAFLLAAAPLNHVIVASLEMFAALHSGATFGYGTWAVTAAWYTLGNVVGGVGLVTVLRLVQVGEARIRDEQREGAAAGAEPDE